MPERTPEERHKKQQLKQRIQKEQEHLETLESIDTAAMLKKDQEARKAYNRQIDWNYYASSKFFGSAAKDMGKQGAKMGARQAFGLLLAEVWFELKAEVPLIYRECRDNFQLKDFLNRVGQILKNICERVKSRFKEMLSLFKDGFINGLFSSISTTIWNAFQTIGGNAIKIIRESWSSIIQAVKLVFFNPNQLSVGELVKEVTRIVGAAASIAAGAVVNSAMLELLKFIPFDFIRDGLAAFVSALISGILTIGLSYFLDHSEMMQKVWAMLDSFKSKYQKTLEHFQEINAELDRYLVELSKIEFNMNALEFGQFADALVVTNDEFQRSVILNAEILRRNIKLPFEAGDTESVRGWLGTLSK
ncbi:hypothetical protein [Neisseria animaloris]|uniref:hypothetical protein n=1 Tax=Neisseria animaloris TaxID=326522 RepID=UPI000D312B5A|nr:hypothetical protein [Neisseria animaloris]